MLIAVTGLAGVGKSTAVRHLETRGFGPSLYVGSYVLDELKLRGLAETAENERRVRQDLRDEHGRDVLARRALEDHDFAHEWPPVLLDAICLREEAELYRTTLGRQLCVVGIEASFEVRAGRLSKRQQRSMSPVELAARDQFEFETLGLTEVVARADHKLCNETDLGSFTASLNRLVDRWISERRLTR
jgi:dephospho-CoA kinase